MLIQGRAGVIRGSPRFCGWNSHYHAAWNHHHQEGSDTTFMQCGGVRHPFHVVSMVLYELTHPLVNRSSHHCPNDQCCVDALCQSGHICILQSGERFIIPLAGNHWWRIWSWLDHNIGPIWDCMWWLLGDNTRKEWMPNNIPHYGCQIGSLAPKMCKMSKIPPKWVNIGGLKFYFSIVIYTFWKCFCHSLHPQKWGIVYAKDSKVMHNLCDIGPSLLLYI